MRERSRVRTQTKEHSRSHMKYWYGIEMVKTGRRRRHLPLVKSYLSLATSVVSLSFCLSLCVPPSPAASPVRLKEQKFQQIVHQIMLNAAVVVVDTNLFCFAKKMIIIKASDWRWHHFFLVCIEVSSTQHTTDAYSYYFVCSHPIFGFGWNDHVVH